MPRLHQSAWSTPSLALALALAWLPAPAAAGQATPVAASAERYIPVLQDVPSPPRWFAGSDGRVHLAYELLLTNAFPVPVTVSSVEVLDVETGATLAALEGDALGAATSLLSVPGTPATTLPPSTVGAVWLDVAVPSPAELPEAVAHRLTVGVPPGLPVPATIVSTSRASPVDLQPPVVLGPPLAGPRWLALGSCCDGPHRRAVQPIDGRLFLSQRFAVDFNVLDAEDRLGTGDLTRNEDFPSFGRPVLAVADATVVAAVDRFPDQVPNDPVGVTLESADGNHVVLDLGGGRFAFYAHLEAGSVAVQAGERVRRGQRIGDLGNSGSSTGPHLHFHVMDGPSALAADGLPYVFDRFDLAGRAPSLEETIALGEAGKPIPIDPSGAGPRRDELPLGRDVVDFAGGPTGG